MAGLGCGASFLHLGRGRNDWLYSVLYRYMIDSMILALNRRVDECLQEDRNLPLVSFVVLSALSPGQRIHGSDTVDASVSLKYSTWLSTLEIPCVHVPTQLLLVLIAER